MATHEPSDPLALLLPLSQFLAVDLKESPVVIPESARRILAYAAVLVPTSAVPVTAAAPVVRHAMADISQAGQKAAATTALANAVAWAGPDGPRDGLAERGGIEAMLRSDSLHHVAMMDRLDSAARRLPEAQRAALEAESREAQQRDGLTREAIIRQANAADRYATALDVALREQRDGLRVRCRMPERPPTL